MLRVVPIAPLAGRPRSAGWLRSPGRLFGMARTIAANAAYPSVGHIPLRRELDDATGMGAERLIIDGKARTASASRDGTAFSAVAPRERPAWLTVRAAKQLKRTYFVPSHKSKHAAAAREHGDVLAFAASGWACDRFADPRGVAGKFGPRIPYDVSALLALQGQPQTAVTGLRSPVVWGAVIVVQLAFPVTIVPIVGTIAQVALGTWGCSEDYFSCTAWSRAPAIGVFSMKKTLILAVACGLMATAAFVRTRTPPSAQSAPARPRRDSTRCDSNRHKTPIARRGAARCWRIGCRRCGDENTSGIPRVVARNGVGRERGASPPGSPLVGSPLPGAIDPPPAFGLAPSSYPQYCIKRNDPN